MSVLNFNSVLIEAKICMSKTANSMKDVKLTICSFPPALSSALITAPNNTQTIIAFYHFTCTATCYR